MTGATLRQFPALTARELMGAPRPHRGLLRTAGYFVPMQTVPRFCSVIPYAMRENESTTDDERMYIHSLVDIDRLIGASDPHILYAASRLSPPSSEEEVSSKTHALDDSGTEPDDELVTEPNQELPAEKLRMLEDELSRLRAMIASVVTKQEGLSNMAAPPPPPPPPIPGTTAGSAAPGMPPPPPPPPPPPGFTLEKPRESIQDIVRKNRKGQTVGTAEKKPSMADVLSKLGTVKLKSVERSPGGTPLRGGGSAPAATPMDPAAMIAIALKKKFAKQAGASPSAAASDWEAKENEIVARRKVAAADSAPSFGAHMLRKTRKPMGPAN